jgi:diaminopropionate ammonia-lyase
VILLNPRYARAPYGVRERAAHSLAGFELAKTEITAWPGYEPTPLVNLRGLAHALGIAAVHYKDEAGRFGLGSFKALGGAYGVQSIVGVHGRGITVTTATDGNHGRSVAWGAQMFGCRAVIYVPVQCSVPRERAIARYGAEVVRTDAGYDETVRRCAADAARHGRFVVSDTSWPGYEEVPRTVTHGYAVMVDEALSQADAVPTHVFVQGGVGALAAAVAGHLWERLGPDRPRVIVVEPETAACLMESAKAGHAAAIAGDAVSVMAGLACGEASPLAWDVLDRGAFAFMTVADDVTAPCMRLLANSPYGDPAIIAGESAVAGLAGLMAAVGDVEARVTLGLDADSRVLLIGSEGATDPEIYAGMVGTLPTG